MKEKKKKHKKHKKHRKDPASSSLVADHHAASDEDDEGVLKHHHHHHQRHVHPSDSEEEYNSDFSYDSYGSSEDEAAEVKKHKKGGH